MVTTQTLAPFDSRLMETIGVNWLMDDDGAFYVANELLVVDEAEANAYFEAANTLVGMYLEAGQHVIDNDLFTLLGIPEHLIELIRHSWEDADRHVYGRFDFAGGLDGLPIQLVEFNADTPTGIVETAVVLPALLKVNGLELSARFDNLYHGIRDNLARIVTDQHGLDRFDEFYTGEILLFSCMRNGEEDEDSVRLLERMAQDAGYNTAFCYFDEVGFSENDGIFGPHNERCAMWFKLWPWEIMASEEPELVAILTEISRARRAVMLNPAYTVMFQSKGMLPLLKQLFPQSPLLVEASTSPLAGIPQVAKPMFGREGANLKIFDENGRLIDETDGPYNHDPQIYQALLTYPKDRSSRLYQTGVYIADQACGLSFRRGGTIIDENSQFVGHRLVDGGRMVIAF